MPLTETKSTIGTKKMIFVCCPLCGSKTRIKIRTDTVLEKFPLFCPKCKQEMNIPMRRSRLSGVA